MALPERVLVIVVESDAGRSPETMPLLNRRLDGRRLTPVFSTMQLAIKFLARAQELGYFVKLDYIFPAAGGQLDQDFPEHDFELDPAPESFFTEALSPPVGEGWGRDA